MKEREFTEADFSMTARAMEGRSADRPPMIKFETFPHPTRSKVPEQGHPCYDDREYIHHCSPETRRQVHRPVWARIRRALLVIRSIHKAEQTVVGLPLKLWGGIKLRQANEFDTFT